MNKTYRSVLLWGVAALICLIALVTPSYAANLRDIPGFKPGPGDYYDASGKLYAVDGKLLRSWITIWLRAQKAVRH